MSVYGTVTELARNERSQPPAFGHLLDDRRLQFEANNNDQKRKLTEYRAGYRALEQNPGDTP